MRGGSNAMNQLLSNANDFLSHGGFEYAICGGFALDLFTNTDMRIHSDIDVSVFEKDKNKIYLFMKKNKWNIYEFCGQGIVYLITSANDCQSNRNFMCVKDNCEIVKFFPCDRGDNYFFHEFFDTGIKSFNYIEFLFNESKNNDFIFNSDISREMSKAILKRNNIPYLSPELVLLYKSENFERKWYQYDYEKTIAEMNSEQRNWFIGSLDILYPNGHIWR